MSDVELDLLRQIAGEVVGIRRDLRNAWDAIQGLSRSYERLTRRVDTLADDLASMIKAELGGHFAHLETRLELDIARRIAELREGAPQ